MQTVILEVINEAEPNTFRPPSDLEIDLELPEKAVSPISLSGSSAQSFMTSPQEPPEAAEVSTTTAVSISSPPSLSSKGIQTGDLPSPQLTPTRTAHVAVAAAVPSNPLHCRVCLADSCDDITASMCGHIFCNRCVFHEHALNVNLCPHSCITDAVIKTNRCPVCMTPTLLYCLFRLDLAA